MEKPKRPDNYFEIHIQCNPATGEVKIAAPMGMKPACIKALSTAIQIVVDYDPIAQAMGNGHS